jgi:hypothetical protein
MRETLTVDMFIVFGTTVSTVNFGNVGHRFPKLPGLPRS